MNVIITGGSKGIGKAVAMKFAEAGHDIILCARNKALLEQAADEIYKTNPGIIVRTMAADLSNKSEVLAFGDWCLKNGTPGVLVNNAGVYLPGNAHNEPDDNLETMMQTNLYSAYHLTRRLVPEMIKEKAGHIFNIGSIASLNAYDDGGGYSISKFALHGFSKNLRHELKPYNIKVTEILAGAVMTDSWAGFDNSQNRIMLPGDIAEMIYAASNLSPQAVVEEILIRPQLGDL